MLPDVLAIVYYALLYLSIPVAIAVLVIAASRKRRQQNKTPELPGAYTTPYTQDNSRASPNSPVAVNVTAGRIFRCHGDTRSGV